MPELTVDRIPYNTVINWNELVQILSRLNEPLKVEVADAEGDVVDADQGDELMVRQLNMERYAVSPVSDNDGKDWTREELSNETVRSAKIPTHFRLFPRHYRDHCFRSVREIIETLPAVYKLIFTIDGFEFSGKYVKPKERMEMLDLVRDSATGSRLLLVKSVKTGMEFTLNENMEAPFFQLPGDCYNCGEHGISASDLLASWIPGQLPFIVKYVSPPKEVRQADIEKKFITLKPDKKNKHRVKSSKSINVCQSTPHVRDCFPQHLQDQRLLFRPYYAATAQNITRNQEDIVLPENSKLSVRILPPNKSSRSAQSSVNSRHSLSSPRASSDQLQDIVSKVNWRTTTFLITGGEIATILRELDFIRKGHRIAVLKLGSSTKAVMVSQRNEMFLVGTAYGGKFKCDLQLQKEISVEVVCKMSPPFDVEVIAKDQDIGYDQLHIRGSLKVNEILTEWTAYVEVFGSDGQKLSHQPFEIPLCRNPLHARPDEPISIFQLLSLSKAKYVSKLPVVEMVTEDDVDIIRSSQRSSHQKFENGIQSYQGAGDATLSNQGHGIRRSLGPDDEVFRSQQRQEDGICNYHGHDNAMSIDRRHVVGVRSSLGPDDEIFRSHQRQEDGIWNYHGHDNALSIDRRHVVGVRRSLGPDDEIFRSQQRQEDGIRNYHHGRDDAIRSYQRKEDGTRLVFNFENVQAALLEVNSDEEISSPDNLYTKSHKMNPQPSTSEVPPRRPPKSPALRRKEYERMQCVETGDELLRLDITDAPITPQRPPKPDRFKSPPLEFSSNNNNNIDRFDDAAAISTGVRFESKRDDVTMYMPVPVRQSIQDNLKSTTIEVAPAPELSANPKEEKARQSSFQTLHESYNPWNFTKENSKNSSYELLSNSKSSNSPTTEYATYVDPRLIHKKHSKLKSAQTIPNPNYEDSIQVTVIPHQQDHKGQSNVTANDANSCFQRCNALKDIQQSDYTFADDPDGWKGTRKATLTDDNLDYEYIPPQHVKKHPDHQGEDYEVAVYEEISY